MAQPKRKAAIKPEILGNKRLSEISAADFLEALNSGGKTAASAIRVWGGKKLAEYWVEPENGGGGLPDWWNRKKWLEREKPPGIEALTDIRDLIRDPVFIKEMATAVAAELKGK
jgi:hypothetical protein